MYKILSILIVFPVVLFAVEKNDLVIINKNTNQNVVAPAINPSKASQLRKSREEAEIATETAILEKIETERLKFEQEKVRQILENSNNAKTTVVQIKKDSYHAASSDKVFLSIGTGHVGYLGPQNLNSSKYDPLFLSVGGFSYNKLLFDFTSYYSRHAIRETHYSTYPNVKEIRQFSGAMALKYSFLRRHRLKPYVGISGAYTIRLFCDLLSNSRTNNFNNEREIRSIDCRTRSDGFKRKFQAFDAGPVIGLEIPFTKFVGLNVDFRYHVNVYTENARTLSTRHRSLIDEVDSVIFSTNLRFYF